ncbi:MSP7-like protein [Plasmodium vivax]|uniref:Merozoite surface protein 7 (MSP7) n=6 Tax=Plasmodium vivax TaxID=5855 RepID=A0A0J9VUR3_PLAVI|nr:merozoite surface protein 7 (MSP7) [Plasmodium vivax India VII]KMZ85451.1 merozoite surface protein 7 (MSP7) [Plasmodium vivax Brazil I]KMZ91328.1 merozoite surface protein 7 (MSP7) [Plasmodium vivax Mauritania I]KMZ98168.1 merozoite surface protein 7 (MSP7) [Plasmodium vivax North Korean]CAG9473345.1 unnamed protein product [Plasmodium vivax]
MKTKVLFFLPPILLLPHSVWSETKGPSGPPPNKKLNANALHFLRGKLELLNKISEEQVVSPDFKKNVELLKKKIEELQGKAEKDKSKTDGEDTTPKEQQEDQNVSQNGLEEQAPSDSNEGEAQEENTQVKNVIFTEKEEAVDEEAEKEDTAVISEKANLPNEESQGNDETQTQESIEGEASPGVVVDETDDSPEGEPLSGLETEGNSSAESAPNEPDVNTTHTAVDTHMPADANIGVDTNMPFDTPPHPSGENPGAPQETHLPSIDENANRRASRMKHMSSFLNGLLTNQSNNKKEIFFHPYYGPYFNHGGYYNYDPYYNYAPAYNPFVSQARDYEVIKKLLDACFNKGEGADPNVPCIIDIFKKVLDDERFRNELKTFMYDLYEFLKKNDVLSDDEKKNELMRFFFDNAFQLVNPMFYY